jgi:nicotinamidase-related amidase
VLPNIVDLIGLCREHDCKIIFIRHSLTEEDYQALPKKTRKCCIKGTGGDELDPRLPVHDDDIIVMKTSYSAFWRTDLDRRLDEHGIKRLLVVGTKTNNCVYATVLDAYNRHYPVSVIRECVGTKDRLTNQVYLRDINAYLGEVIGMQEVKTRFKEGEL